MATATKPSAAKSSMLPGTPCDRDVKLDLSPSSQPPPWITTIPGRCLAARVLLHRQVEPPCLARPVPVGDVAPDDGDLVPGMSVGRRNHRRSQEEQGQRPESAHRPWSVHISFRSDSEGITVGGTRGDR